jgi:hypothetical protein
MILVELSTKKIYYVQRTLCYKREDDGTKRIHKCAGYCVRIDIKILYHQVAINIVWIQYDFTLLFKWCVK